ncbi:uncharacterized protein [Ptychodera flava]|uniref:uncharacterized protein n=1 Tax=Ptychodera flava TaxID=63121 RepID=UPI00396A34ED
MLKPTYIFAGVLVLCAVFRSNGEMHGEIHKQKPINGDGPCQKDADCENPDLPACIAGLCVPCSAWEGIRHEDVPSVCKQSPPKDINHLNDEQTSPIPKYKALCRSEADCALGKWCLRSEGYCQDCATLTSDNLKDVYKRECKRFIESLESKASHYHLIIGCAVGGSCLLVLALMITIVALRHNKKGKVPRGPIACETGCTPEGSTQGIDALDNESREKLVHGDAVVPGENRN